MLDTKATFDDLVAALRAPTPSRPSGSWPTASTATSPGPCPARRSTWRRRSSTSSTTTSRFDLVVVDTPPTRNALDFLEAPARLTRFLDHRLYRAADAADPGRPAGRERGRAGVPADDRPGGRRRRARRRRRLLPGLRRHGGGLPAAGRARSPSSCGRRETAYVLVTAPRRDTVEEARYFARRLAEGGTPAAAVIVNRVHPDFGPATATAGGRRAGRSAAHGRADREPGRAAGGDRRRDRRARAPRRPTWARCRWRRSPSCRPTSTTSRAWPRSPTSSSTAAPPDRPRRPPRSRPPASGAGSSRPCDDRQSRRPPRPGGLRRARGHLARDRLTDATEPRQMPEASGRVGAG